MDKCSRCSRYHSGVCGIPGLGTMRNPGIRSVRREGRPVDSYKPHARPKTHVLAVLLTENLKWQLSVKEQLNRTPPELPEYDQLLERYDKLLGIADQIQRQIAAKRG